MNWQEAISQIESSQLDASLNVVSGTNAFFKAADKEPAVREARRQLLQSGELHEDVLNRIYDLADSDVDPQYANPNDTALAVLLWLSYFSFPDYAHIAAGYVRRAPQCWYARKLADRILNPPPSEGDNEFAAALAYADRLYWELAHESSSESVTHMTMGSKFRVNSVIKARAPQSVAADNYHSQGLGHVRGASRVNHKIFAADDSSPWSLSHASS